MNARGWSAAALAALVAAAGAAEDLRVGLIGLDSSHCIGFTKLLNDRDCPDHVPGAVVTAAFKGGSADVERSYTRVDGFTRQLAEDFEVRIVPSIPALCEQVDAVMLLSVDGRPHLEQARPVIEAGLPLFVDKPVAGSLADAIRLFALAEAHDVPCFSSSCYRFFPELTALLERDLGAIRGAVSYGACHLEEHHPDLFWYGVHPAEALYTVLGTGCQQVTRTHTPDTDVATGLWEGGRTGVFYGLRNGKTPHKVVVFGRKEVAIQQDEPHTYAPLIREVVRFFKTGRAPVPKAVTLELFAFMEAADESKTRGGVPVSIAEVMAKAQRAADGLEPRSGDSQ